MSKPNLRTITGKELTNLQIDDNRQLYWNGERIRNQITLTYIQTFSAVIVVVAGLATIFNGFSSGLNNLATFVCGRGQELWLVGCPIPPAQAPTPPPAQNPTPPPAPAPGTPSRP